MTKQEFLSELRSNLSGIPKNELEERLAFYSEMIDDRIEDGMSEAEAVIEIGSVESVSEQIISEIPLKKFVKEKIKPKRKLRAWEIVLLSLGSPIWISLIVSAFAVVFSLYASIWSVVASLWAVFASFAACLPAGLIGLVIFIMNGNVFTGIITLSAGLLCAGLSIFAFFGCRLATKGMIVFTKKLAIYIKKCFINKEDAKK